MSRYIIIVSGPQGSGKSTQAERASRRYGMPLFEAGLELRDFAEGDTPEALAVRETINRGQLAPHEIVNNLFRQFVHGATEQAGVISDGFPRSMEQWHVIAEVAEEIQAKILGIYVKLSQDTAVERIANRVEIENGKVEKRDDDTPDAIRRRFQIYHTETIPVLNYIRSHHQLIEIDGSPSADDVSQNIFIALDPIVHG